MNGSGKKLWGNFKLPECLAIIANYCLIDAGPEFF
jgi:hypothetical protein